MNVKTCTRCRKEKPATNEFFHKSKDRKSGLIAQCKTCIKKTYDTRVSELNYNPVHTKACCMCNEIKIFSLFYKDKYTKSGLSAYCRECIKRRLSHQNRNNRLLYAKEYAREYRAKNKEMVRQYSNKKRREYRNTLHGHYLRGLICKNLGLCSTKDIPKEFIETYRLQCKIKRLLKHIYNENNKQSNKEGY